MKHPTPNDGSPTCFGQYYRTVPRLCRPCPVREDCEKICQRWAARRSLSEILHQLEQKAAVTQDSDGADWVRQVYTRLYQKHFGRTPRASLLRKPRWHHSIVRLVALCSERNIDPAVWITAQMHGMKLWITAQKKTNRRVSFQTNMLVGKKAERRYIVYLTIAKRRFHQARDDTLDGLTETGRFIDALTEGEEAVGHYFVAAHIEDAPVSWEEAVRETEPTEEWLTVHGGMKDHQRKRSYVAWTNRYGHDRMKDMRALARTRAMVNVARQYHYALPDRIGVREEPTWESLAPLLARFCGKKKLQVNDLEGVTGMSWGFSG